MTGERRRCGFALTLVRMSTPVMSGRLRSSRTSRQRAAFASPEPSSPSRYFRASVPLVNGTISLFTPARRMLRSIRRAWPSSSSTMTMTTGRAFMGRLSRVVAGPEAGRQIYLKGRTAAKLGTDGDVAAQPPHQGAHMGETDSFAGLVLGAGPPEQLEDAFMVLRCDAATIVADRRLARVLRLARQRRRCGPAGRAPGTSRHCRGGCRSPAPAPAGR